MSVWLFCVIVLLQLETMLSMLFATNSFIIALKAVIAMLGHVLLMAACVVYIVHFPDSISGVFLHY